MTMPRRPYLTTRAHEVFSLAHDLADQRGDETVTPAHLLLGLLQEGRSVAVHVLHVRGVPLDTLASELEAELRVARAPRSPGYQLGSSGATAWGSSTCVPRSSTSLGRPSLRPFRRGPNDSLVARCPRHWVWHFTVRGDSVVVSCGCRTTPGSGDTRPTRSPLQRGPHGS